MDCSTFSFDLHVLGAPPALILSRDQTLVYTCELIAPTFNSESLTNVSCASNQIVKELRRQTNDLAKIRSLPASKAV